MFFEQGAENISFVCPKICQASTSPSNFNGSRSCKFSGHSTWMGICGLALNSAWRFWRIYYKILNFIGIFQLEFCLKTFQTCSLLYISVLNVAF